MTLLIALRWLVIALSTYHLRWTFPAVCAAARGMWGRREAYRSSIFFLVSGTFAFQSFAVIGVANEATRLMSLTLIAIGLCVLFQVRVHARHYAKFDRLFAYLDGALAIVDLWLVDREAAEAKAAECRRLTVEAMSRG